VPNWKALVWERKELIEKAKTLHKELYSIIIIINNNNNNNTGLAVTIAICCFMYTTNRLGLKLSLFQQFLIKVKHQQMEWYQRLCIQHYKIRNMLENVNRL